MEDLEDGSKISLEDNSMSPIRNNLLANLNQFNVDVDNKCDHLINYGDLVLIYETRDQMRYFILERSKTFQNKYGTFKHDDIYGKTYGSKLYAAKGKDGYVTILSFVTHLWERCMNRITMILFNPDIAMIMTFLNIRNDSVIYESGTGSGCLSTNMSQTLNEGHLYTFEFNLERATKMSSVFKVIGMDKRVTVIHRDVVEEGFEVETGMLVKPEHHNCDGIFIDLPSPWLVVQKAKSVLKQGGSFVSFSPCIEQIDETMKALRENDFMNPRIFECMYRNHNFTRAFKVNVPNLSTKRKFGEPIPYVEKEIFSASSKNDMRGHTGFLIYAINI